MMNILLALTQMMTITVSQVNITAGDVDEVVLQGTIFVTGDHHC